MDQITYQREIQHCSVSPYVKEVTIASVTPARNSDKLDCIKFAEIGWQCVSQKGLRKEGQKVLFIPPESVLPFELGEKLDITKYLSKGRVRVTGLRGNRSEGLIVERELVEEYLPYILKWEDLPTDCMNGDQLSPSEVSPYAHVFYKMPNILNEPETFAPGEEIQYSEKIHGTNWRVGKLPHPVTEQLQLYVGQHEIILKESVDNIYLRASKEVQDRLPDNVWFFGEIFGKRVQKLHYDTDFGYRFFAASVKGEYISHDELVRICKEHDLPCVKFSKTTFVDTEQLRELAEGNSEYANHLKEGIVAASTKFPERMAKCISFAYLSSRKRTERH